MMVQIKQQRYDNQFYSKKKNTVFFIAKSDVEKYKGYFGKLFPEKKIK
jgi:hypothetical protein